MGSRHIADAPLVSAIVPAYNAERYIGHTLQSLVAQSYPHLEIIVVDDGSTDRTRAIVEAMAEKYSQIRMIRQLNQGVAAARNRGIADARGEFIAPIDADDIWFPDAMQKLVHCLHNADPCIGVAYGWSVTLDENSLLDGGLRCSRIAGDVLGTLICHNFLGNASATVIRRQYLEKVVGYDPRFRTESAQGCEDWDLYVRLAEYCRFAVVPEFLFGYRRPRSSMSSNSHAMANSHEYLLEKVKRHHPRIPQAFYQLSTSSYYLHLAYECDCYHNPNDSLYWLQQAMMKGPIFTFLRPGFYWLMFKNLAAKAGLSSRNFGGRSVRSATQTKAVTTSRQRIEVADVKRKKIRIFVKVAVQEVLHRVVRWLPLSKNDRTEELDKESGEPGKIRGQ